METASVNRVWRAVADHRWLLASVVVLVWSVSETINLALVHNTGAELYGVLTAAISTGAAAANVAVLRSPQAHRIATIVIVAVWVVVALGGIAGVIAHVVGPVAGHGPIDLRPRPVAAPLVFTLLGFAGAASILLGHRARVGAGRPR